MRYQVSPLGRSTRAGNVVRHRRRALRNETVCAVSSEKQPTDQEAVKHFLLKITAKIKMWLYRIWEVGHDSERAPRRECKRS